VNQPTAKAKAIIFGVMSEVAQKFNVENTARELTNYILQPVIYILESLNRIIDGTLGTVTNLKRSFGLSQLTDGLKPFSDWIAYAIRFKRRYLTK